MSSIPIGEADLHAYVDGQLDDTRRAEVEAFLAAQPDAAAEVHLLREQNQALHAGFDSVLNEPVPLHLSNAVKRRGWPHGIAAGFAWLACGLVVGWLLHGTAAPPPMRAFAQQALAAHVLYTVEIRHPVEVPAAQEAHLVAWLSKRLDAPIHAPDLQQEGFALLGGRLLPGGSGPLAQLMYQAADGQRLTLIIKHAPQGTDTGFRLMQQDGTSVFYWIDRDYGYALSGSIDRNRLLAVARAVDRQLPH